MVGGFISRKAIAAVTSVIIACTMLASCGDSSSAADTRSSSQAVSSSADTNSSSSLNISDNSSSEPAEETTTTASSSVPAAETSAEAVWTPEDFSTFVETELRGKPIEDAKQILKQRIGADPDKWKVTKGKDYTLYEQELDVGIRVCNHVFTTVWFEDDENTGTINLTGKAIGFYSYFSSKVGAEGAEEFINKTLKEEGYQHDKSTFASRWLTSKGMVSFGAISIKDTHKLAMAYWAPLPNTQQ